MEMAIIDTAGKETLRRLRVRTLEVTDDGDKSLAIFDTPADVKGTAFLSHTHIQQTVPLCHWDTHSLTSVRPIGPLPPACSSPIGHGHFI